ncbi:MAG: hypothetical protein P8Z38_09190 [Robiginitalea sp.]|jgi:hypothetical protein
MHQSSNNNGFRTPDRYFEHLPDRIMDRIQKDEIRDSEGKYGFQVPEGYFEAFADRLEKRLPGQKVPVRRLWPATRLVWIPAAAAVIAFLLLLIPSREESSLQFEDLTGDSIAEYLQAEAFDLSSYELAESLPLGEIAMEDVMEKMPEQQQIMDYLETHTDTDDEFYLDRDE